MPALVESTHVQPMPSWKIANDAALWRLIRSVPKFWPCFARTSLRAAGDIVITSANTGFALMISAA